VTYEPIVVQYILSFWVALRTASSEFEVPKVRSWRIVASFGLRVLCIAYCD